MLFAFSLTIAQKVDVKEDFVQINGKNIFKYEKKSWIEYAFYNLNDNEVINIQIKDNSTTYENDDFFVIYFPDLNKKIYSKNFEKIYSAFSVKKRVTTMIKWLTDEKVVAADGSVNIKNIDNLIEKYGCKSCEYGD